jgi:hypothetical protein
LAHKRKNWRTNAIFLIVIWIILLIASVTILSSVVTPFLRTLQTQNLISLDWSGYAVSSNVLIPAPQVTAVNGSWTVPTAAVSSFDTFSAAWIGIGGQSDTTLIQVGSEHDSINAQTVYSLWYEMLPADAITISTIQISPGDRITASISLANSSINYWIIEISDVTTGQSFKQNFVYNSTRLTAEWVIERPTVNNQLSTLANFGAVTFTDCSAQLAAKVGTISAFPNSVILMEDRQNNQLVKVSDFSRDGSSFAVTYA